MLTSGRSRATRTGFPKLGRVNAAQQAMLLSMGAHFGFQAVVTVVVYPALLRFRRQTGEIATRTFQADRFCRCSHIRRRHFCSGLDSLLGGWSLALLVAICAILLVLLTTSLVAAPLHKTLARDGRLKTKAAPPANGCDPLRRRSTRLRCRIFV